MHMWVIYVGRHLSQTLKNLIASAHTSHGTPDMHSPSLHYKDFILENQPFKLTYNQHFVSCLHVHWCCDESLTKLSKCH